MNGRSLIVVVNKYRKNSTVIASQPLGVRQSLRQNNIASPDQVFFLTHRITF